MQCARLSLQQRRHQHRCRDPQRAERYCRQHLVDPSLATETRFTEIFSRYCNLDSQDSQSDEVDTIKNYQVEDGEDMFLTVQNLKFQGNVQDNRRPRTCFKYKNSKGSKNNRMFIRGPASLQDMETENDDGTASELSYYFDDYVKYLLNNEKSRPPSRQKGLYLCGLSKSCKQNKAVQVDAAQNSVATRIVSSTKTKSYRRSKKHKVISTIDNGQCDTDMQDAKIAYHDLGTRKSITITRSQTPESMQVIRVDVVCNNRSPKVSDYEEEKLEAPDTSSTLQSKTNMTAFRSPAGAKYLLTKTIRSLSEQVSSGDKVTLMCKTFRLRKRPVAVGST